MTFEEYKDREDFLEFAKIGTTFAHLEINNHELTHEEMEFFNDKVFSGSGIRRSYGLNRYGIQTIYAVVRLYDCRN